MSINVFRPSAKKVEIAHRVLDKSDDRDAKILAATILQLAERAEVTIRQVAEIQDALAQYEQSLADSQTKLDALKRTIQRPKEDQ